jgi:hypothetical protein
MKQKKPRGMTQVVECLPSTSKVLIQTLAPPRRKRKRKAKSEEWGKNPKTLLFQKPWWTWEGKIGSNGVWAGGGAETSRQKKERINTDSLFWKFSTNGYRMAFEGNTGNGSVGRNGAHMHLSSKEVSGKWLMIWWMVCHCCHIRLGCSSPEVLPSPPTWEKNQ